MSALESHDAEVEAVVSRLQLPTTRDLAGWGYLGKLVDHPGSCIAIIVENPFHPDGPRVGKAWLSAQEREAIRNALQRINERRRKQGDRETNLPPTPID